MKEGNTKAIKLAEPFYQEKAMEGSPSRLLYMSEFKQKLNDSFQTLKWEIDDIESKEFTFKSKYYTITT